MVQQLQKHCHLEVKVMAIDKDLNKGRRYKDFVAYTVAIDATNMDALKNNQNIQDMDCVIVAIGENFHSAILYKHVLIELGVKESLEDQWEKMKD